MYDWFRSVLQTDADAPKIAVALKQAALDADAMVGELFEFRNYGIPLAHHWSTQHTGAAFGTDYLMRTAVGKSNIFVNTANETTYYYQNLDDQGERLDGSNTYTVHGNHRRSRVADHSIRCCPAWAPAGSGGRHGGDSTPKASRPFLETRCVCSPASRCLSTLPRWVSSDSDQGRGHASGC
ncbi:hypothetical protein [Nonomuraea sp. NPDC001699]